MTVQVRHDTASGRLDEGWRFSAGEHRVYVRTRMGNVGHDVSILVCSRRYPVLGAHPIVRIDGESWCILPARYVRTYPRGVETLTEIACSVGDELGLGERVVLSQCPADVDAEIDQI